MSGGRGVVLGDKGYGVTEEEKDGESEESTGIPVRE